MKKILRILKWMWSIIAGLSLLSVIVLPFLYAVLDERLASWIFWIALLLIILYEIIPHKRRIESKNKFQKVAFGGFPLLLFIFASVFIINYYDTWYNGYWFIFILAIFAVPYGFIALKAWYEDRYETTKEDNKNAILNIFKLTLFYWLADLFYMAWFKNWILWQYIFGGLILLIVFFNLSSVFLANSEKNKTVNWVLLQDFVIGIALTIYLIYIIPEQFIGLQNVVTTIVAAVYGGLLTLVGVAWTIRRQDEIRKEEEKKKHKPIFTFNMVYDGEVSIGRYEKNCFSADEINKKAAIYFDLENSSKSVFTLSKIFHDGMWKEVYSNSVFLPNSKILFYCSFSSPKNIYLEILDGLENKYYYELTAHRWVTCKDSDGKLVYTIVGLKEITLEEINERIKKAEEVPND